MSTTLLAVLIVAAVILAALAYYFSTTAKESETQDRIRSRLAGLRGGEARASALATPAGEEEAPAAQFTQLREDDLFKPGARARTIRYDLSEKIAYRLAQANIPFKVGQYVMWTVMGSLVLGITAAIFVRPILFFPGAAAGVVLAIFYVRWKLKKRVRAFTEIFPDSLDLLSNALKTGHAFPTALQLVAEEMPDPLSSEIWKIVNEMSVGLSDKEALMNLNERIDSIDVQLFVTSVLVQKEVGGNLAEVLGSIGETIRQRFRIMGQVEAYTAQARLSGKLLVALPVVLAAVLYVFKPEYIQVLWIDPQGQKASLVAITLWVIGFIWIRRIVNVKL